MNEVVDNKRYIKATGIACLLLAAVGISFVATLSIDFIKFILDAPNMYKDSILYLIGGSLRIVCYFVYVFGIIISIVLSVEYILNGVALIRQSPDKKQKNAITFSFIVSLIICLASLYPFILHICRIMAHGYKEEYYFGFWFGMVAFIFSTVCLVFNRIAAKKRRLFLTTNSNSK